jgi:two-component system, cell cycle response regulator
MESGTETWRTVPARPRAEGARAPLLVHIYPPGQGMGKCYPLNGRPLVIGRGNDSDLRIPESSVSRSHARIDLQEDGYYVTDLGSTNGTYVNDALTPRTKLEDGDYVRVGNCIYRFLSGGNVEAEYHEEIYRLSIIDALTDIANKRHLLEFLDRELARSARHRRPLALVLFDIDLFKQVNDELGHLAGDNTLRELAAAVRAVIRTEELFARYGGEEFAVVLPETDRDGALAAAERIRALVERHPFRYEEQTYQVTVSLGVAATKGDKGLTSTEFIRQADARLYEAKRQGRNRVVG